MPKETLIRGADCVLTMDDERREIASGDVLIRDRVVAKNGHHLACQGEIVSAKRCVLTPGLVNTHHHLFQTLTRAAPNAQDALLLVG